MTQEYNIYPNLKGKCSSHPRRERSVELLERREEKERGMAGHSPKNFLTAFFLGSFRALSLPVMAVFPNGHLTPAYLCYRIQNALSSIWQQPLTKRGCLQLLISHISGAQKSYLIGQCTYRMFSSFWKVLLHSTNQDEKVTQEKCQEELCWVEISIELKRIFS